MKSYKNKGYYVKKQLLTLSIIFAMNSVSASYQNLELNFFDETDEKAQWSFMEKKFITDPAQSKQVTLTHVVAAGTSLAFAACLGKSLEAYDALPFSMTPSKLKDATEFQKQGAFYWPLFTVTAGGLLGYNYLQCYVSNQANRAAVQEFFANYKEYQFFVPAEFTNAFDLMAEIIELEGMDFVLAHANDIVSTVEFFVTRHFESRYKSTLEAKGRDALADSKTVIENFKNLFDGAGKMVGGKSKGE